MSLSFLSRQDVENWVPQPAPSRGGAGFVAKLFTTINRAMASLSNALSTTEDDANQRCRNEFERFFLWGQGLSILEDDLDEVLAHSKELHFRVLSLLLRLGTVVLESLSRNTVPSSQVLTEQCYDLRNLLDTTEGMLQEGEHDELAKPDTSSESDASEYEMTEVVEEISVYVDCLLDLSPSLDNPALDIQIEDANKPQAQAKESFAVSSEVALIYCRKIRDRFELLPIYLVERLAEANVVRAGALREMRSRPVQHEAPNTRDDVTESLFSATDHRVTSTTRSTDPSTMWSRAPFSIPGQAPMHDFDDNASEATFASVSTASSTISLGRPRVPPIPEVLGDGFNCPVCFRYVTSVKTRNEWKKHVFEDLRPYLCTIEDCKTPSTLYDRSGMWAQHEAAHPASTPRSFECLFCSAIYQQKGAAYFKHISAHLREVSLAVLPQPSDGDSGFDTDDSNPSASAPISQTVHPDTNVDEESGHKEGPSSGETEVEPGTTPGASAPSEKGAARAEEAGRATESPSASAAQKAAEKAIDKHEFDLESIVDRLLEVRGSRPGEQVHLLEAEIRFLCTKAREIFVSQPILLELEPSLRVVGDIHGQYYDLLRLFEYGGFPPEANYLFLGNYVDHGKQSLEVICLLLAYKIMYPENFFLLRGNHEDAPTNRRDGFYHECIRRYNIKLWKTFTDTFNCMPIAAIVDEKIFCMHGGLSPNLNSMEQIRRVMRPTSVPDRGVICDLLWGDPDKNITGWSASRRGVSYIFGPDVVSRFLRRHGMDLVVRGNQVVNDGYEIFSNRKLVTLWSAPNFKGEYDNAGAMMTIGESLLCSFQVLKPAEKKQKFGWR